MKPLQDADEAIFLRVCESERVARIETMARVGEDQDGGESGEGRRM